MNEGSPGYYAVIPASVRYDDTIPANAKLLYGEISALLSEEGFCYASNSYFADLYKVSERTITGLVSKLQKAGHIVIELERDKTGLITSRKLFLASSAPGGQPVENIFYTPRKYFREGMENNFQYTNTSNTNIEKESIKERKTKNKSGDSPPETPFDPLPLFIAWIGETFPQEEAARKNILYFAMQRFSENRTAIKKPFRSKSAVTALCNRLLRYTQNSRDQVLGMVDLLDDATSNNWQSIYPPKQTHDRAPAQGGRVYECL